MKLLSAFNAFIVALIAQIFALAIAEGFGGLHLSLFGSRKSLLYLALAIGVIAAVLRWRQVARREASPAGAAAAPSPSDPPADPDQPTEPSDRLNRLVEQARESAIASGGPVLALLRPTPSHHATKPGIPAAIEAASRQAIVFRQLFPPPQDGTGRSFFGGMPLCPGGFDWPRADTGEGSTKPLHFLMQVDCADIPEAARLGLLPDQGVLYFFLDFEWGESAGHRVLHLDAPASDRRASDRTASDRRTSDRRTSDWGASDWVVADPPRDLGPVFGAEARHIWPWAQSAAHCPNFLPKWPFEPVMIDIPAEAYDREEEEDGEDFPFLWPGDNALSAQLVKAQGEEVVSNPLSVKELSEPDGTMHRPYPHYPHDWRAVQIFSAKLVHDVDRAERYPRSWLYPELSADEKDVLLARIEEEAQAWFDHAAARPPFAALPQPVSDEFWAWLTGYKPLSQLILADSATLSIETSLAAGAESTVQIPADIVARVHARHALAVRTDPGFHINTPDRMLAPPVDVQGNQWERARTHLLLLEMSSNEGLGHHFGEGVYQFWITPEDLEARRFDKVELTTDAY